MSAVYGVQCDTAGCSNVVVSPRSHTHALQRAQRRGWKFTDPLDVTRGASCHEHSGIPQHNHVTRDIKAPGKCPACDATRVSVPAEAIEHPIGGYSR